MGESLSCCIVFTDYKIGVERHSQSNCGGRLLDVDLENHPIMLKTIQCSRVASFVWLCSLCPLAACLVTYYTSAHTHSRTHNNTCKETGIEKPEYKHGNQAQAHGYKHMPQILYNTNVFYLYASMDLVHLPIGSTSAAWKKNLYMGKAAGWKGMCSSGFKV